MVMIRRAAGNHLLGFLYALVAAFGTSAFAFQLSPSGTVLERHQVKTNAAWYQRYTSNVATWGVYQFTHPVHEEITQLIFDCDADGSGCSNPEIGFAPVPVIAGVRWNDDPPFRLSTTGIAECRSEQTIRVVTQPTCWYKLFKHAETRSHTTYFDGKSKRWNIMYRSHFGDLQFLHAMASRDGESAEVTRKRVLMWAEFAWSVATGKIESATLLKNVQIGEFGVFFGESGQSVLDLYTLGNSSLRRSIREVAFGSLLHVVEDSFAFGHADRAPPVAGVKCAGSDFPQPGRIRSFRSYTSQDHKKHGAHDSLESLRTGLSVSPNVVDVGKVLLAMYDKGEPWTLVGNYLQCVFEVENGETPATAGDGLT
jgi:hypothetical protein